MANINAAFGIRPINDNGTPWSGQGRMVCMNASEGNNIFLGDPIVPLGGSDAFGVPLVGIASAGATDTILGGFIGRCNGPAGSGVTLLQNDTVWRHASVLTYGFVCDDPNQLYTIQEDSVGGAIATATGGFSNANLVAGTGSQTTGFSGWMLQSSTLSAAYLYQMRIVQLLQESDNAVGTYAKWLTFINNHPFNSTTGI